MYGLMCSCPMLYVGQTSQQLRKRMQKYLSSITLAAWDRAQGKKLTTVVEHFRNIHGGKLYGLKIVVFRGGGGPYTGPSAKGVPMDF